MLDEKAAGFVMDLIADPLEVNPYETLKAKLVEAFAVSDSDKAVRLLDMTGMGDKTA